ncbi:MAG: hypothetical protein MK236_08320, partial [Pedosphaera sp.]|nr:hypothetical protein [Pedosphaera sp.]
MEEPKEETIDQEPIEESPIKIKPRWWPAITVLALLLAAVMAIWSSNVNNQQARVLQTGSTLIISFLLLIIWALIFSRFSKRIRLRILFSLVGGFIL